MGFHSGLDSEESVCHVGDVGSVPGQEDPLEKGMATHSTILTWRIPWTEEHGWVHTVHRVTQSQT